MHKFEKRDAKSRTLVILAVVGLAAAITVGIFTAVRMLRKPPASKDDPKTGIVYDDSAVEGGWDNLSPEEIAEKLNEKVAEGMINISMNTAPYFENGTAEGNVMIVNEDINLYPQQVEFIRNDTQEVIYQSKAIPVGSKIERAALDVELPAGTYECTAMPVLDGDFEAFVTNLGKYNEGMLVGEWVKLPTTEEEMQKVFERIGIGKQDDFGQPYEEWFITDYECPIYGVQKMLGEYESLDKLNYVPQLRPGNRRDYRHGRGYYYNHHQKLIFKTKGVIYNEKL